MTDAHDAPMVIRSYNRQCPDCRKFVATVTEPLARRWLLSELRRPERSRSTIRINNAIAIWQQAVKWRNAKGRRS